MLEDYCTRLQELNQQKNAFLKLKYKSNIHSKLEKQQNKYHKYILTQITYKNRLNSLYKFNDTLMTVIKRQKKQAFDVFADKILSKNELITNPLIHTDDLVNDKGQSKYKTQTLKKSNQEFLKEKAQKVACKIMIKWINARKIKMQIQALKLVQKNNSAKSKFFNIFDLFGKKIYFQKNAFLDRLKSLKIKECKNNQTQILQNKSFIFSLNQFSEIIPYTIEEQSNDFSTSGIVDIKEIDSKFKPLSISKLEGDLLLQSNQAQFDSMLKSFQKLKEEVQIMKNLLIQKNKQTKSKDEQICKIKGDYEKRIQSLHDQISDKIQDQFHFQGSICSQSIKKNSNSKNTSEYLKQLQSHIIGDRSPRGISQEKDHVSDQLLQKYMKESFQKREKMDMAREMCEQFQFDLRTQEGQLMLEIIKLLTPEERLNAYVD